MNRLLPTSIALIFFASNSLLCRLALRGGHIDAGLFTGLRLLSGAIALALILAGRHRGAVKPKGNWISALALFAYAAPFSFAYLELSVGTGALILFGSVQATMIGWDLYKGSRPPVSEWIGLLLALAGLIGLTAPGVSAPDPLGSVFMAVAGIAWGIYSLRGKGSSDPLADTAGNFVVSVAFVIPLVGLTSTGWHISEKGLLLAVASGALASGVGYAVWYAALRGLTATRAAIVQLLAPVIAAGAGVLLLGEEISTRLIVCGAAIVAGVALAIIGKK